MRTKDRHQRIAKEKVNREGFIPLAPIWKRVPLSRSEGESNRRIPRLKVGLLIERPSAHHPHPSKITIRVRSPLFIFVVIS